MNTTVHLTQMRGSRGDRAAKRGRAGLVRLLLTVTTLAWITYLLYGVVEVAPVPNVLLFPKVELADIGLIDVAETVGIARHAEKEQNDSGIGVIHDLLQLIGGQPDIIGRGSEKIVARRNIFSVYAGVGQLRSSYRAFPSHFTKRIIQEFPEYLCSDFLSTFWNLISSETELREFLNRWTFTDVFESKVDHEFFAWNQATPRKLRVMNSDEIRPLVNLERPPGFFEGIFGRLRIPVGDGKLADTEDHSTLSLFSGKGHIMQLLYGDSDIGGSSERSYGSYASKYYLSPKVSIVTGSVLTVCCWFFMGFGLDPKRWVWQLALCLALLMVALVLVAQGIYAIA